MITIGFIGKVNFSYLFADTKVKKPRNSLESTNVQHPRRTSLMHFEPSNVIDPQCRNFVSLCLSHVNNAGMLPVRWMAPESLMDGLFTPMTDIWSYGVLLYEVITFGSFPFQGLSNNQVLEHVKNGMTIDIPEGVKPQL